MINFAYNEKQIKKIKQLANEIKKELAILKSLIFQKKSIPLRLKT